MNKFILNFIIIFSAFLITLYIGFRSFSLDSYAVDNAIVFDQNVIDFLNDQNGAYTDIYSYGALSDPNYICIGIDQIYQDINMKLYQNYGWDLEDIAVEMEDQLQAEIRDSMISKLALGATVASGFQLYETTAINTLTGAKDYVLGKVDTATGKISEVYNNVYTYVSEGFKDKILNVRSELVNDNTISVIGNTDPIYSYSLTINGNLSNTLGASRSCLVLQGSFNVPICYYTSPTAQYSNYRLLAYFPSNITFTPVSGYSGIYSIPFDGFWINGQGYKSDLDSIYSALDVNHPVTLGGRDYYKGYISTVPDVWQGSKFQFGSEVGVQTLLGNLGNTSSKIIAYNTSLALEDSLSQLLDRLSDSWVTSNELKRVNDMVEQLLNGGIVIDLDGNPVIESNNVTLADLETLIESILENNEAIDNELGDPDPPPDPNPNPNPDDYEIPEYLFPSFFPELLDENMFSMFQPIFDIVGGNYSMYSIWILIPTILIFILILYLIVSVF